MSSDLFLLILRLFGAVCLFVFMGGIGWLLYRDMQTTAVSLAQQSQPIGTLHIISEVMETVRIPLLPVTTIGRAATNVVVIDDAFASNEHALLIRKGTQWLLEDLQSRNGTLLNDVPLLETAVVTPSDVITIGDTRLKIE
jgi:hypothetical protein